MCDFQTFILCVTVIHIDNNTNFLSSNQKTAFNLIRSKKPSFLHQRFFYKKLYMRVFHGQNISATVGIEI